MAKFSGDRWLFPVFRYTAIGASQKAGLSSHFRRCRSVGPVEIVREDQVKEVIVRMDASGISTGEVVERVNYVIEKSECPDGVEWEMGGQAYLMAENRKTMGLIIVFAALFDYIILAVQFESLAIAVIGGLIYLLVLTLLFLKIVIAYVDKESPVGKIIVF